ncbi:MAG: cation:proton antiporter subunit C [Geitlerinemataceae cyanobacterium]
MGSSRGDRFLSISCIEHRLTSILNRRPEFTQFAILMLEACVLATILCGFFGIILKKNLVMKIVSMDVMSTGVIAYYVVVASRDGLFTPIISNTENIAYADPVPQAVILTAIVIGFSIQALMLVGVMKLSRDNPTLESHEIEKNNMP